MARLSWFGCFVVAGLFALVPEKTHAQSTMPSPLDSRRPIGLQDRPPYAEGSTPSPAQAQKQAALQNSDRQRRLEADTDKLLALVTQLHADVAKTDKNILSIDVIKRAEEIERLAKSVKDRMKG